MILEMGVLNVIPGEEQSFERAIQEAEPLIARTPGFHSIAVHRCLETPNRYLLLVKWEHLEDHTVGFRQSDRYQQWRKLLNHFYNPLSSIEHYGESVALKHSN